MGRILILGIVFFDNLGISQLEAKEMREMQVNNILRCTKELISLPLEDWINVKVKNDKFDSWRWKRMNKDQDTEKCL